jgi:hypothetical protein
MSESEFTTAFNDFYNKAKGYGAGQRGKILAATQAALSRVLDEAGAPAQDAAPALLRPLPPSPPRPR